MRASAHIHQNQGCPKCALVKLSKIFAKTKDEFIRDAQKVHGNKYDYSLVVYKNNATKVKILCKQHGVFRITPHHHLNTSSGCNKCNKLHSKVSIEWLDYVAKKENIYIQHAENDGEYKIHAINSKVDGFCKKSNTVYEFNVVLVY